MVKNANLTCINLTGKSDCIFVDNDASILTKITVDNQKITHGPPCQLAHIDPVLLLNEHRNDALRVTDCRSPAPMPASYHSSRTTLHLGNSPVLRVITLHLGNSPVLRVICSFLKVSLGIYFFQRFMISFENLHEICQNISN